MVKRNRKARKMHGTSNIKKAVKDRPHKHEEQQNESQQLTIQDTEAERPQQLNDKKRMHLASTELQEEEEENMVRRMSRAELLNEALDLSSSHRSKPNDREFMDLQHIWEAFQRQSRPHYPHFKKKAKMRKNGTIRVEGIMKAVKDKCVVCDSAIMIRKDEPSEQPQYKTKVHKSARAKKNSERAANKLHKELDKILADLRPDEVKYKSRRKMLTRNLRAFFHENETILPEAIPPDYAERIQLARDTIQKIRTGQKTVVCEKIWENIQALRFYKYTSGWNGKQLEDLARVSHQSIYALKTMRRGGKRLLCFVEGREDLIKDMILPEDGGYPWGDQLLYYPEVFYYKSLAKITADAYEAIVRIVVEFIPLYNSQMHVLAQKAVLKPVKRRDQRRASAKGKQRAGRHQI